MLSLKDDDGAMKKIISKMEFEYQLQMFNVRWFCRNKFSRRFKLFYQQRWVIIEMFIPSHRTWRKSERAAGNQCIESCWNVQKFSRYFEICWKLWMGEKVGRLSGKCPWTYPPSLRFWSPKRRTIGLCRNWTANRVPRSRMRPQLKLGFPYGSNSNHIRRCLRQHGAFVQTPE